MVSNKQGQYMFLIVGIVLVVAVLGYYFLFMKKKKGGGATSAAPVEPSQPADSGVKGGGDENKQW